MAKVLHFVAGAESEQSWVAAVGEADGWRESERDVVTKLPGDYWREVAGCVFEPESLGAAEAAVEFSSGGEVFAAEAAFVGGGEAGQRAVDAEGVAELDAFTRWQLSGFVSQVPVWCWAPAGR